MPYAPTRPATTMEIEDAVMNRSAAQAANWLGFRGRIVTVSQCSEAITRLNRTGVRQSLASAREINTDAALQRANCDNLLRAHLRTGNHWITDAERFARVCKGVGV